jgi:hypothetical protein
MIFKKCSECDKTLIYNRNAIIYRCCDTYVCSKKCSLIRFKSVQNYDPELNSPTDWHSFNKPTLATLICDTKSVTSINRTKSLNQIFEDNTTLKTIHENFSLYNIKDYEYNNEMTNHNKKIIKFYKHITIQFVAISLLLYNIYKIFRQ